MTRRRKNAQLVLDSGRIRYVSVPTARRLLKSRDAVPMPSETGAFRIRLRSIESVPLGLMAGGILVPESTRRDGVDFKGWLLHQKRIKHGRPPVSEEELRYFRMRAERERRISISNLESAAGAGQPWDAACGRMVYRQVRKGSSDRVYEGCLK